MNTTSKITAAALAALAMGACTTTGGSSKPTASSSSTPAAAATADAGKKGECWGINACKGQGACGGADGHECAGQNACKGQGWLSLTKPDCDAKGGKFKPG